MMIPQFMRFYKYTAEQTLQEYAIRFFSLVNSMYRLQANEALMDLAVVSSGMNDGSELRNQLIKQSKGLHGIVEEIRIAKAVKK